MSNENILIPFTKSVRIGNFKLWRSRMTIHQKPTFKDEEERKNYVLDHGKIKSQRFDLECVNVSNLDDTWKVQIPSTSSVYLMICDAYNTTDDEIRDKFLGMVFTNYYNLCTTNSEALHDAFFFLHEMMTFPYLLLPEKEMKSRMKSNLKFFGMDKSKIGGYISNVVDYRRQLYELIEQKKERLINDYEKQMNEHMAALPEEKTQLDNDEMAETAMQLLNEPEES